jgi:hypothetical protein
MGLRLTEKEARDLGLKIPEAPKRKFHNRPGRLDGIAFDSQLELRRYAYLVHVEMAGLLEDLKVHPTFDLYGAGGRAPGTGDPVPVGVYEADFSYIDERGQVVEDTKGVVLPLYTLKRNLFLANYPQLVFMEVRQCRKRWISQAMTMA